MARTKGSKNKSTLEKEAALTGTAPVTTKATTGAEVDDDAVDDGADDISNVRLLTKDGTWGYIPSNRNYVTLIHRIYYAVETATWSPRGGDKIQAAGTYGPWQMTKSLYPSSVAQARRLVAKTLFHDNLKEAQELMSEADAMEKAWDALDMKVNK